jgi:hypothetical protein
MRLLAGTKDYSERRARRRQGNRDGYRMGRMKTAKGLIGYPALPIAGQDEALHSTKSQGPRLMDLANKGADARHLARDVEVVVRRRPARR